MEIDDPFYTCGPLISRTRRIRLVNPDRADDRVKEKLLKLIAIFEIATGVLGMVWVVRGFIGSLPHGVVTGLWFGIFPIISLGVGVLFWRRWRTALALSYLVLVLQTVVIQTREFSLNVSGPLNLTINGIWNARPGFGGAVIGINLVALTVILLLLFSQSAFQGLPFSQAMERKSSGKSTD